ncbi:hypothetical protein ACVINI_000875 [Rhizobium beringeri]
MVGGLESSAIGQSAVATLGALAPSECCFRSVAGAKL